MVDQGGYANADLLWSPAELAVRLQEPTLKVIDVRPGERFAMGHIPGARHFDIYGVNCDDTDELVVDSFVRMWTALLGQRGVRFSDTVVIYDDIAGSTAARGFWFLEYLGHADTHLLDGGYNGWTAAGLPTTRDAEVPSPAPFEAKPVRERLATRHDILARIEDRDTVVLDTRSREEYLGTDIRSRHGGTIPGAVHLDWREHLTPEGFMKPADALRSRFEDLGVTADKDIVPFCQTGYRSAHAYLAMRLLGYPRVRNYLGSWKEWGNRDDVPITRSGAGQS
ncbi:MAG: sulfurtransferase [Acetobacterales bacterium]